MSAAYDPLVARALDELFPVPESDPDETLRGARLAAQGMKKRRAVRLRRTAILALAALLLLAGAALAASHFDVFPWLDQSNRSTATFSIDSSQTYHWPAADVLVCPQARAGAFSCSIGAFQPKGRRTYLLAERVSAQPKVSRRFYLEALATAERKRQVDHAAAQRFRRDVAAVGDDFFSGLALLIGVESVGGDEQAPGRPGFELVPPAGVPMWIACEASGRSSFDCHPLAESRNVPVGTPLYFLESSSDWVAIPRQSHRPVDVELLFRAVLGRDLTPAEERLLLDLTTTGEASGGSGTGSVHAEPTKPQHGSP